MTIPTAPQRLAPHRDASHRPAPHRVATPLDRATIPPLRPDRLAASNAIDVQMRRRNPWPERAMRAVWVGFWAALGFAVAGTIWVLA